jgi:hypothetical protein
MLAPPDLYSTLSDFRYFFLLDIEGRREMVRLDDSGIDLSIETEIPKAT